MHKKLEAELVSLAHSILQMKNKDDVSTLQKKARKIYEKLSVLKFVDKNLVAAPKTIKYEEEVIDEMYHNFENDLSENEPVAEIVEEVISVEKVEVKDDLIEVIEEDSSAIQFTLQDEFKDAISADVATNLFEKATKENPVIEEQTEIKKKSLNDTIFVNNIQVGLNDRIAFVNHLFEGNQEDFNRVLSQLNSFKSEVESKEFINNLVKLDYDWNGKDEYEERLISLIERKFM